MRARTPRCASRCSSSIAAGRSTRPTCRCCATLASALRFALQLLDTRGRDAEAVHAVRAAGFDDAQIVEIVAHVALNLFTNYVNVALAVPLDFPPVALRRTA